MHRLGEHISSALFQCRNLAQQLHCVRNRSWHKWRVNPFFSSTSICIGYRHRGWSLASRKQLVSCELYRKKVVQWLITLWQLNLCFLIHAFVKTHAAEYSSILVRPHSIYFSFFAPMPLLLPNTQVFNVLCVAVGAKVTCLAVDCILWHWFP